MPSPYRLNQKGVPAESFAWLEAFETWTQRTETHVNWTAVQEAGQWLAVAKFNVNGRVKSFTGQGTNIKKAKANAVIQIEGANVLSI